MTVGGGIGYGYTPMNTDKERLDALTEKIIGCAFQVECW